MTTKRPEPEVLPAAPDARTAEIAMMAERGLHVAFESLRGAGLTYRQICYWSTDLGLIVTVTPTGRTGTGTRRYVTDDEVAVVTIAARLAGEGLLPARAMAVARDVHAGRPVTFGGLTWVGP